MLLPSVKASLSEFAASLMSRTPALRTHLAQTSDQGAKALLKEGAVLPQLSVEDAKRIQASLLIKQTPLYASILSKMGWIVITNETSEPFWTSDSPLVKYNPEKDDVSGNLGLLSRGIQIYVPLSPTLLIGFVDPKAYNPLPRTLAADTAVVQFCNSAQVMWSLRYVYSREPDFSLADRVLDKSPMFSDPDRPRVVAN